MSKATRRVRRSGKRTAFGRFLDAHKAHPKMLTAIWTGAIFLGGVATAGWNARDYVILRPEAVAMHASQDEQIQLVGAQAQYVLDINIQRIYAEIVVLEQSAKRRQLTATEIDRLNYLRGELERLKRVKAGK